MFLASSLHSDTSISESRNGSEELGVVPDVASSRHVEVQAVLILVCLPFNSSIIKGVGSRSS